MLWVILFKLFLGWYPIFFYIYITIIFFIFFKESESVLTFKKKFSYSYLDFFYDFFYDATLKGFFKRSLCSIFAWIIHAKILLSIFIFIFLLKILPPSLSYKILKWADWEVLTKMFEALSIKWFFSFKIFKSDDFFYLLFFNASKKFLIKTKATSNFLNTSTNNKIFSKNTFYSISKVFDINIRT